MGKVLYAVLVGLVGAAIVHVALLLLLPRLSDRFAWTRLEAEADLYATVRVDISSNTGARVLAAGDPAVRAMACRFDLRDGILRVSASGKVPFWSASVYDDHGRNVYSLNDRSTEDHSLKIVVLTPEQMAAAQSASSTDIDPSAYVEVPLTQGIAVVRVPVTDASWERTVSDFLASARCGRQ